MSVNKLDLSELSVQQQIQEVFKKVTSWVALTCKEKKVLMIDIDSETRKEDEYFLQLQFYDLLETFKWSGFYDTVKRLMWETHPDSPDRKIYYSLHVKGALWVLIIACARRWWTMKLEASHFDWVRDIIYWELEEFLRDSTECEDFSIEEKNKLRSIYGITTPHRYNHEILKAQLDSDNDKLPYWVLVSTRYDDNWVLNDPSKIDYRQLQELWWILRVVEVDSKRDILKRLIKLNALFWETNRISFVIISAHWCPQAIWIRKEIALDIHDILHLEWSDMLGRLNWMLHDQASIHFNWCSTGTEWWIAHVVSRIFWKTTVAWKNISNINVIEFGILETGLIIPNIEFWLRGWNDNKVTYWI